MTLIYRSITECTYWNRIISRASSRPVWTSSQTGNCRVCGFIKVHQFGICSLAFLLRFQAASQNKSVLNNIKAPNVEDLKLARRRDDDTAGCFAAVSKALTAQVAAHHQSHNTLYFYCFLSCEDGAQFRFKRFNQTGFVWGCALGSASLSVDS